MKSLLFLRRALTASGLLGASFTLTAAPAWAQLSETDVLRQQILELQNRLNAIEDTQRRAAAAPAPAAPTVGSSSRSPVTVASLLQFHALSGFSGDQLVGATGNNETFRFRRGEIRLTAPAITPTVGGTVMFDVSKTGTGRDAVLQEYSVNYLLNSRGNDRLFVDAGQFKIPFGFEGDQVSSGALQTVERALFFRSTAPGSVRLAGDQRDTGIRLRGNSGPLLYQLGVFNGLGERQNQTDDNANKAIAARVAFSPAQIAGLQIGASYARGRQSGVTSGFFGGATATPVDVSRDLYNAYATFRRGPINLQTEYFRAELSGAAGFDTDSDGYYVSLGYLLNPAFEVVGRFDRIDSNLTGNSNTAPNREATLGVNYYLRGNNAKIQANLVDVRRGAGSIDPDSLELRTNFQVAF